MTRRLGPEEALLSQVIDLSHLYGWRVAHFRPARVGKSWRTPVQGDGKGFPDFVLARDGRVIFAELKSNTGKLSDEQQEWLHALAGKWETPGHEVYVWRPRDWDEIVATLSYDASRSRDVPANRKQFEVVPDGIAYSDWIAQEYPALEGFEKLLPKEERRGSEEGEMEKFLSYDPTELENPGSPLLTSDFAPTFVTETMLCRSCGSQWQAVYPSSAKRLECPYCGVMNEVGAKNGAKISERP